MLLEDFPLRSPLEVAEVLRPYYEGKVICDLGCSKGDLVVAFSKYAKHAMGVDSDADKVNEGKQQSRDLRCIHLEKETDIPVADVYYIWTCSPKELIDIIPKGLIFVARENGKDWSTDLIQFRYEDHGVTGQWTLSKILK